MSKTQLKELPSVSEVLLEVPPDIPLHINYINHLIRTQIQTFRRQAQSGVLTLSREEIIAVIVRTIQQAVTPTLRQVINGTGIVLHTGLGRAPLSAPILKDLTRQFSGYVNLELDLDSGKRGDRLDSVREHLAAIVKAESALVVNNNAAAVLLALNTLAEGSEVVVSRGQQVEIGGSFRIPDIIRKSHCVLREVGTTNRTHLRDYEAAITAQTALLLWVHTSNYLIEGFTSEVSLKELVTLGKRKGLPVMADLGSGALVDFPTLGLPPEWQVNDIVKTGAAIVTFSGDKLLGGPQAGIIVGKKHLLRKLQANPIYRAVRCDKMTLYLLNKTLQTYRSSHQVASSNLTLKLLTTSRPVLKRRGERLLGSLSKTQCRSLRITLVESEVEAGSGSLPVRALPSMALKFRPKTMKMTELAARLRQATPPVVGYISGNAFYIDLKAILPSQIVTLSTILARL
ncbi:MAG: L-seryl-tRNA(Sec) selenium transferase [Fidelibacterota bacterium]